jgi:hypothetical protein
VFGEAPFFDDDLAFAARLPPAADGLQFDAEKPGRVEQVRPVRNLPLPA